MSFFSVNAIVKNNSLVLHCALWVTQLKKKQTKPYIQTHTTGLIEDLRKVRIIIRT